MKDVAVPRACRSHLAESALLEWSDSTKTAVGVIRICRAGQRDGINIPMNSKIAGLGTADFKNCNRDLDTLLQGSGAFSHVVETGGNCFTHCLPPPEVVRLLSKHPTKFQMHLAPNREACRNGWRSFVSSEEGIAYSTVHPHLKGKTVKNLESTIPCRVHEDSGPFSKVKSVDAIQWSSLVGRGTEKECKYQALPLI